MAFIYIGCRVTIFTGLTFTTHAGATCLYHPFFSILQLALLAIPTMLAASSYSLLKTGTALTITQWQILAVGFFISFIVALIVIAFFINYISKRDFKVFGYYRIILGLLILFYLSW